jgi:hypothetical protein
LGTICFVATLFSFSVDRRRESGPAYHGAVGAVARRRVPLSSPCSRRRVDRLTPPKKKAAYVSHEQRKFARIVDRAAFRGLAGNQVAGIIVFTILEA